MISSLTLSSRRLCLYSTLSIQFVKVVHPSHDCFTIAAFLSKEGDREKGASIQEKKIRKG